MEEVYIKIMAEQGASPVWEENGTNMEIDDYNLSPEIAARLKKWSDLYNAQDLSTEDHGFDFKAFAHEGRQIAKHIKAANPDWQVMYFDEAAFADGYRSLVEIK